MDTINDTWRDSSRIGDNVPTFNETHFENIESYIIEKCQELDVEVKFNVGSRTGGILHPKDINSQPNDISLTEMSYHDLMGGIILSSRNAELNCRYLQNVYESSQITNTTSIEFLKKTLLDKYVLNDEIQEHKNVIFFPGSNLLNTIDFDKCEEICIDYNASVKPHPILTKDGKNILLSHFGNNIIDEKLSGLKLLLSCENRWISFSSELGLISAIHKLPFANIGLWDKSYHMTYSSIYRLFRYKDVNYNYDVINKILFDPTSGVIFPWQTDYKERINTYFKEIIKFSNP